MSISLIRLCVLVLLWSAAVALGDQDALPAAQRRMTEVMKELSRTQADVKRQIGGGAFSLSVWDLPVGSYQVVVYGHEPATNTFPVGLVVPITVRACSNYNVSWPFYGVTGWVWVTYQVCG